jgi:prepilin-type processing-associated H-X9-DG protein
MATERPPEGPPEMEANAEQSTPRSSCALELMLMAVCVGIAIFVLWKLFFRPHPDHAVCLSNVKNISLALQMYVADNDDRLPPADGWGDGLYEYVKNREVFNCPHAAGPEGSHAYNASLDGVALAALADPGQTIVVFESDSGWNAVGGPELLPDIPRHSGGDHYGFADGHVEGLPRKQNPDGTWAKEPEAEVIWDAGVEAREPEG